MTNEPSDHHELAGAPINYKPPHTFAIEVRVETPDIKAILLYFHRIKLSLEATTNTLVRESKKHKDNALFTTSYSGISEVTARCSKCGAPHTATRKGCRC